MFNQYLLICALKWKWILLKIKINQSLLYYTASCQHKKNHLKNIKFSSNSFCFPFQQCTIGEIGFMVEW